MTETPTDPDLFEAWARLRRAVEQATGFADDVCVRVEDLAAVLDAPGQHALTKGRILSAIGVQRATYGRHGENLSGAIAGRDVDAMRAAIAEALGVPS